MRKTRLAKNTISSVTYQITSIVCGFILPRVILSSFGSDINGLVNSIVQFLSIIAFLELGVGAVVQSALYKPLADRDDSMISKILKSAELFFRRLSYILIVYIVFLIIFYPRLVNKQFGWLYTATLIIAISISSFSQYYFGVVDRLLLTADQKGYIQYNAQTITLIGNTILCIIAIKLGASIHVVKLTTSLIYLLRPIYLRHYTNKHYNIDRKIKLEEEPIKQKWNGVAQHFAAVVLDCTDTVVLTAFTTLDMVSVYSVYYLVISGVKQLLLSSMNGVQSLMGELWAKGEDETLKEFFGWVEWVIHSSTIILFGCTASLIVPFVQVYTKGVNDANYAVPLFGLLLTLAHGCHCLRLPYNIMILAGNHYKQTQHCYIIAAFVNIVVSVGTVRLFGLIGVAIGTLVAMVYQTVWMAYYLSKNFFKWPFRCFIKQVLVDALCFIIAFACCSLITMNNITVVSWIILSFKKLLVWLGVFLIINILFYSNKIKRLINRIKKDK